MKEADIDKIKSRNKRMKNENESQHDKIDYAGNEKNKK